MIEAYIGCLTIRIRLGMGRGRPMITIQIIKEFSTTESSDILYQFDRKKADVLIINNKPRVRKKDLCREYSESD